MALASAALFGASTPLAKLLLGGGVDPWLLAGLLYLGSGLGLGLVHLVRGALRMPAPEAPLRRGDLPWLGLVVLAGGVIGPLLLMLGLARTPASTAALFPVFRLRSKRGKLLLETSTRILWPFTHTLLVDQRSMV